MNRGSHWWWWNESENIVLKVHVQWMTSLVDKGFSKHMPAGVIGFLGHNVVFVDRYDNSGSKWSYNRFWSRNKRWNSYCFFPKLKQRYFLFFENDQTNTGIENHLMWKISFHRPIVRDQWEWELEINILCNYVSISSTWWNSLSNS